MTISWFGGKRIRGLSTDNVTEKIQNNTIFEATDTQKKYWLKSIVGRFESLYRSFVSPNLIPNQHFVEWFSGSSLSAIWTQSAGSPVAMVDDIDGGIIISTSGGMAN